MRYENALFGSPLAFVHGQAGWARTYCWPWEGFLGNLRLLAERGWPVSKGDAYLWLGLAAFCWAMGSLCVLAYQSRKEGRLLAPALLAGLWLLMPLLSTLPNDPLACLTRFCLPVFPLYLAAGWLPARVFWLVAALSGAGLVAATGLFSAWWWVA